MTPAEQARAFGAMLLCGACMGVVYDMLGIFRCVRGLCAASDILFGICCASGIVWTALRLEMEAFRLYAFAGAACGMALYGVTLGMIARRIAAGVRIMMEKREKKPKKRQDVAGN